MTGRTTLFGLALIAISVAFHARAIATDTPSPAAGAEIRFSLRDTQGGTVSNADLRGRWVLAFFGYTSCPDLCPTVLLDIAQALTRLGPLAARVQPIFVSVDPQHDTPAMLKDFVRDFDERIMPLTGTAEELQRAADAFGVAFFRVSGSAPDDYTITHSAFITLLGPEGGLVVRFSTDASADEIASKLRRLIDMRGL
jgi:protein SCO1/2